MKAFECRSCLLVGVSSCKFVEEVFGVALAPVH